jgi:hypothetical protein
MARKRGGLAGVWDRNKKVIKPIAAFTAGMINPALGAAVGAAMGGLDREGKGGIGFDLKQGAIGGLQGYGMGKLGAASKGKLAGLFSGGGSGATSAAPALGGAPAVSNVTSRVASQVPELVTRVNPATLFAPSPANPSALSRLGGFVKNNQGLISGAGKAVAGVLGQQAERAQNADQVALGRERLGLDRDRFALEQEEIQRERERRERVARLLMPLFDQQASELNMRRG